MTTTTTRNVVISENEFEFLKDDSYLTEQDLQGIIENKDLFDKFIGHTIKQIRFDMLNLQFKSKEEVEIRLDTLMSLRKGLDKTLVNYKQYKADLEKEEEPDTRTIEQIEKDKELLKIKLKYKV